jgi:hypothetical protein
MSLMSALARMEAAEAGRAQPAATVLHRHLAERPFVLAPLTTAGEAGAPLGAMVGTERAAPRLLVVPQPRDPALRAGFLARLADAVLPHLESAQDDIEWEERKETDPETGKKITVEVELCAHAPQLLVPNAAGVAFLRLLGRSARFRRTADQDPESPYPAPPRLPLLGRWLTHYGERARVPGQSLLLSMTELLTRHWATGQSSLEDQHLGALLAWIEPLEGMDGGEAALRAEVGRDAEGQLLVPPAGPATDPAFDNDLLAPAVKRFDDKRPGAEREITELIASQLRPTWDAVWRGLDLLRALPEGEHVAERWKRDRWSYTGHRDRLRTGEPPQPRQDDAVTAAAKLAVREGAQARLDAQEALDDPLAMAERRLAGSAFAGEVVAVEMAYSDGRRPMPRPLVTLRTEDRPQLAEGGKAHRALAEGGKQSAELAASPEPGLFTLRLTGGMGRGKEPAPGTVPEEGEWLCWTLFEHSPRGGPGLPEPVDTPWTHGGPPPGARQEPAERPVPEPDPVTSEDLL